MKQIVVVGSWNTDLVVKAPHMPAPGETIIGSGFFIGPGGKGANQAVAAARLGANVSFVGKVGNDNFGIQAIECLKQEGINTVCIFHDEKTPTGIGIIIIDDKAENSIVVDLGANYAITRQDIDNAMGEINNADIILMQLEIPVAIVEYVATTARKKGKKVILNSAPAQALPDSLYKSIYVITPNETEAEILTGVKVTDIHSAGKAAGILKDKGVEIVVITMGEKGAYVLSDTISALIPARKVNAVDTTAAGDSFNGALAVAIAHGMKIEEAVRFANAAASLSVTKSGALSSTPYLADVRAVL